MKVKIKITEGGKMPKYATEGAAGFDLCSSVDMMIGPGRTELVPTGLYFEIPVGYELQVRPRSGMSLKSKIRVANAPGTVDSDYRGEVKLILDNNSEEKFYINEGDRLCQGVIQRVERVVFEENEELSDSSRGEGGFGSTGTN